MAKERCPRCGRYIIKAITADGAEMELAEYNDAQLWGVRAGRVMTPLPSYVNVASKAKAYVEHDCGPETLDAPPRAQEFPSIGDPVPIGESVTFPEPGKLWHDDLDLDQQARFNDAVSGRERLLGESYPLAVKNIEATEDLAMKHWILTGRGMD